MKFKILTIFPEFFENAFNFSLLKKARERGLVEFEIHDLRKWAKPRTVHLQVDDRPYGGGAGMVMMVEPIYKAIKEQITKSKEQNIKSRIATAIFSPKGQVYDQTFAVKFANEYDELILIAPHYEGFDERILNWIDYEICVGDYVLTGGEIPALTVVDSVARLLPGVLGNENSTKDESFSKLNEGIRNLEYAQYTRPEVFVDDEGGEYKVPEVLLSGHHGEIEKWREENSNNSINIK
jgi:tRNA (guanine37-N1)-methyltransferase